ncbi:hypothetical protein CORC01_07743 [Colletotrichum orchidophilum]|uniref:Tyrosinase copper-binding domain-containing protein n=1 Tax=Colletotrichum orchidophilum TaxID=1209926 RepID=A0A1G4B685_9PEZI|nr:uncharacterized protein CORC01_07743 [Colletotrichum orchidophilum]OHE96958.1 hypothetical protein CORC01_07743 [Colletotrichum orchidophilum]
MENLKAAEADGTIYKRGSYNLTFSTPVFFNVYCGMNDMMAKSNDPMKHNPRCLRRVLSSYAATPNLLKITIDQASKSISKVQIGLQGRFSDGNLCMHASGYFVANGDASDIYSSLTDQPFFLYHAMIGRAQWVWQTFHLWETF